MRYVSIYVITVGMSLLLGIIVGLIVGIPFRWLLIIGTLISYYAASALIRFRLSQANRGRSRAPKEAYPLMTRIVLFLLTPLICGTALLVLIRAGAPEAITLVTFFTILIGGHLVSFLPLLRAKKLP